MRREVGMENFQPLTLVFSSVFFLKLYSASIESVIGSRTPRILSAFDGSNLVKVSSLPLSSVRVNVELLCLSNSGDSSPHSPCCFHFIIDILHFDILSLDHLL